VLKNYFNKCIVYSIRFTIFASDLKQNNMTNTTLKLANTLENSAKIKALKKVPETKWVGSTIFHSMDLCLRSICLYTGVNSGYYDPIATRINGVTGWFMINEDGSLFCEARVIKEDANKYRIEYMTDSAWYEFEKDFCNFIDQADKEK
jgi:hypothetical protein